MRNKTEVPTIKRRKPALQTTLKQYYHPAEFHNMLTRLALLVHSHPEKIVYMQQEDDESDFDLLILILSDAMPVERK